MSRLSSSAPAVPSVESAIQQTPQQLFQRGIQCTLAKSYSKALELFNQALLIEPDNADIYGNRCVARHRSGNRAGAITDCRKAAELYKLQGNITQYQYALRSLDRLQKSQADVSHGSSTTEGHHFYAH